MSITSPRFVRELLTRIGCQPSSVLGQNFLIDGNIRDLIIKSAEIRPDDIVLEIGPGLGALTEGLVGCCRRMHAVEKDAKLFGHLKSYFHGKQNVELHRGDFLDIPEEEWGRWGITRMVSNLPYSAGSRILVALALSACPPERMVVTVQREVADRMVAAPDTPERGFLGVMIQHRYEVAIVKNISASCFSPKPDVTSAIVILQRRMAWADESQADVEFLSSVVKHVFMFRRKQLASILNRLPASLVKAPLGEKDHAVIFTALKLDPRVRPESLDDAEWRLLAKQLRSRS